MEEILDAFLHGFGFMHHGHGSVLQRCLSHAVVDIFILLEHPQLHLCLHAHWLHKGGKKGCMKAGASERRFNLNFSSDFEIDTEVHPTAVGKKIET